MAQNDFTIDNQSFPATRADINSAIQALATLSSGPTAPTTPFANQFWMDTTTDPYVLKIRNEANNQWITVAEVNQGSVYFAITAYLFATSGTVTAPSIAFTGDRDTGLYSVGANTLGITTNGTLRYQVGPNGELGIGSDYGTSGQYLSSSGTGSAPVWQTVPQNVTTYSSGSGTWTKPSVGTFCIVRLWGAGGSGGHGGSSVARGAGGAGGGYAERLYLLTNLGSTESYSVGSGGAGVTTGNGNNGGNTTFGSGSTLVTAYGGGGGEGNVATPNGGRGGRLFSAGTSTSTPLDAADPWDGGDGGRGDTTPYYGYKGWMGGGGGGGAGAGIAGNGGTSVGGGNGGAGSISGNATSGTAPAGGGGGCSLNNVSFTSGAGADGRIQIIVW